MPVLYLVRHGEPQLAGALLGHSDLPLTGNGRAQMAAVTFDARVLYCSPLKRSRESAVIAARGREVLVLSGLAEISFGEWDGKYWSEIENNCPELVEAKLADWTGVTPPGGETWHSFTSRVDEALERILSGPMPAAVIAHLAVHARIAFRIAGSDPHLFQQAYAQVLSYEF